MLKRISHLIALCLLATLGVPAAQANLSIEDVVRRKGYGSSQNWGVGLVVGLDGTGDGGEVMPMARPLAQLLERAGRPVPNLADLAEAGSVALVMVTCDLPETPVVNGDEFNVSVRTMFAATDLTGGELLITPLRGPLPGQGVYGFAFGTLEVDETTATAARISKGARMNADINKPVIEDGNRVTLNLRQPYVSENMASTVAE